MQMQKQDSGVSPVIGIILMVAVTVGLVALASTIVFDLGSDVQEPADVSANLEYDEGDSEISAEVVRNGNADRIFLRFTDSHFSKSSPVVLADSSGDTGTEVLSVSSSVLEGFSFTQDDDRGVDIDVAEDSEASGSVSGTVELVAEVDGNEQIIDTVQYDNA